MSERLESTPIPPTREPTDPHGAAFEELSERVRDINRANAKLFDELLTGERRFRRIARAVWRVEEEERRRLARELHDGIGQTLTALKNQLAYMGGRDRGGFDLDAELAAALEMAAEALADTRELSRLLRPPVLDELGLQPALQWLARRIQERSGLPVELELEQGERRLPKEYETLVFRVVQESLNNAVKHAEAAGARVVMRAEPVGVRLEVSDDGRGFDVSRVFAADGEAAGFGLRGITDRVELFGGKVQFRSAPDAGTTIQVSLPVPGDGGQG